MLRVFLALQYLVASTSLASQIITYPNQSYSDSYPVKLLELALSKACYQHGLIPQKSALEIHQGRALKLLRARNGINVSWSMTSKTREQGLRAIKIPIYKGLFGYRIFLIDQQHQDLFPQNISLETLKTARLAIQGHDWPDIKVLQHHDFNVQGVEIFEAHFQMLKKGRADHFPRSILEAWREAEKHKELNVSVEKNLALYYPAWVFFFVHPDDELIGDTIEQGLLNSIKDGSFDQLFDAMAGSAIRLSNLTQRHIIRISNPNVEHEGVYNWPFFVE